MTKKIKELLDTTKCVVEISLIAGGNPLSKRYPVLSAVINREVNRIPTARITILDRDCKKGKFALSDLEDFKPGKSIVIMAGSPQKKERVFQGVIIKHAVKMKDVGTALLTLDCKDISTKLTVGRKSRYFYDQTDSQIIEDILDQASIPGEIADTGVKYVQMVQPNCTDWDFIVLRAEANGLVVVPHDGVLMVIKPDPNGDVEIQLKNDKDIYNFDAEIDARNQYEKVKSQAWNASKQSVEEEEGDVFDLEKQGNLKSEDLADIIGISHEMVHAGALKTEVLQSWSKGTMHRSKLARIRGRFRMEGNIAVAPGRVVELEGVGERFNGKTFISAIRHEIAKGFWHADVQFGLHNKPFSERVNTKEPPAAGLNAGVSGLRIGVVTKLEGDPEKEHRIQVRDPLINKEEEGIWVRMATLDGGENRGFVFRPEIGDEVVMGFLSDDANHPVVLGMLHSSAKPPPIASKDNNHEKGLLTKAGMKLLFNDEKKQVTIATEKGNELLFCESEECVTLSDQHGNSIVMNSQGIQLESIGDITMKAKKNIKIEGANFEVSSKVFKAKSKAMMNLSGGTTIIKGNPINLNP